MKEGRGGAGGERWSNGRRMGARQPLGFFLQSHHLVTKGPETNQRNGLSLCFLICEWGRGKSNYALLIFDGIADSMDMSLSKLQGW